MKVSEAMRKGCEMVPEQCYGRLFLWQGDRVVAACAVGAVILGRQGKETVEAAGRGLVSLLCSDLRGLSIEGVDLKQWISSLNDSNRMKREEIAELLESNGF